MISFVRNGIGYDWLLGSIKGAAINKIAVVAWVGYDWNIVCLEVEYVINIKKNWIWKNCGVCAAARGFAKWPMLLWFITH